MSKGIHVLGASGTGTTTLGKALVEYYAYPHFDIDDYFWLPSDPPFQHVRSRPARQALLAGDLARQRCWVLSGSLCGWGDLFIPLFAVVVFLWVPPTVRLARLAERERSRYGAATLVPDGGMHRQHTAFMAWAAAYDDGDLTMRSRRLHEQWLQSLRCPVLRLEGEQPVEESLTQVVQYVSTHPLHAEVVGGSWEGTRRSLTQPQSRTGAIGPGSGGHSEEGGQDEGFSQGQAEQGFAGDRQ